MSTSAVLRKFIDSALMSEYCMLLDVGEYGTGDAAWLGTKLVVGGKAWIGDVAGVLDAR